MGNWKVNIALVLSGALLTCAVIGLLADWDGQIVFVLLVSALCSVLSAVGILRDQYVYEAFVGNNRALQKELFGAAAPHLEALRDDPECY